mgnify:CR=1 FL=1
MLKIYGIPACNTMKKTFEYLQSKGIPFEFINYKKNGICKYYHSNGNIKELAEYKYDYLVNIQKFYDIDGKLIKTVDRTIKYKYNEYYKT